MEFGGLTIFVRDQLRSGKSIKQIQEERNIATANLIRIRNTLEVWGGTEFVPYINTRPSRNKELESKLRDVKTDEEKQALLNQVKRRFYEVHTKGEDPILMSVKKASDDSGFKCGLWTTKLFVEALKRAGFPLGIIQENKISKRRKNPATYFFILIRDKERAREILLADPNLQMFRKS